MADHRTPLGAGGGHRVDLGVVRGAFPEISAGARRAALTIGFARPYTTDFLGWFDDFSTTGAGFDALGSTARGQLYLSETLPVDPISGVFHPGPVRQGQFRRCPGASEYPAADGSNVWTEAEQLAEWGEVQCENAEDRAVGSTTP